MCAHQIGRMLQGTVTDAGEDEQTGICKLLVTVQNVGTVLEVRMLYLIGEQKTGISQDATPHKGPEHQYRPGKEGRGHHLFVRNAES